MRSGDEPSHARSPLRMRLTLALVGLACWTAGAVAFARVGAPVLAMGCLAGACVAVINVAVVARRIRSGPHWQPGPDIPPYRPVAREPEPRRAPRPPAPQDVRVQRFLLVMTAAVILLLVDWTVLWRVSMPLASAVSLIGMLMLPLAAMAAGCGCFGGSATAGLVAGRGARNGARRNGAGRDDAGRLPGPRLSREAGTVRRGRARRRHRRFTRRRTDG